MNLKNKNIGFALTGSFSAYSKAMIELKKLINYKTNIYPIMSYNSYTLNTKYIKNNEVKKELEIICGNEIIHTIFKAEEIGKILDLLIILPCTREYDFKISK